MIIKKVRFPRSRFLSREYLPFMKKNTYATLDLNKSLNIFRSHVTKLLDFTNFTEWDGKKFQEREEEIRTQALILAGQCISILLYKLSTHQKVLDYCAEQIQTKQNITNEKRGYKNRQIITVGNVEVILKLPYVVERNMFSNAPVNTSKKPKIKTVSQGFYPFLKWLGMSEGITPLVWSTASK